jgi:antitoxin (DNA-binding transcriptional repressor) of toxin-antitoxin stability system
MAMKTRQVGSTEFRDHCLELIEEINETRDTLIVIKSGRPVASVAPLADMPARRSFVGALKGSVLRYDDPDSPAIEPDVWNANR